MLTHHVQRIAAGLTLLLYNLVLDNWKLRAPCGELTLIACLEVFYYTCNVQGHRARSFGEFSY